MSTDPSASSRASVPAHAGPGSVDRRAAPRISALREGRLLTVGGLGPEVLIVDVSATGALVRLRAPLTLPQDVVLIDRRQAVAHRAVVVRRNELDVGLRFLKTQGLTGPVPPALEAAKAWCREA